MLIWSNLHNSEKKIFWDRSTMDKWSQDSLVLVKLGIDQGMERYDIPQS